jgi:hypothetical protein
VPGECLKEISGHSQWLAFGIGRLCRDVHDVHGLLRLQNPTKAVSRIWAYRLAPKILGRGAQRKATA